MPVSEQQLRQIQRALQRADAKAAAWHGERDKLIRQALAEGWKQTELAAIFGLTKGRINQLKP